MQAIAIARATFRELSRRHAALVMLVVLPLAFYLARRDIPFSAVVELALGLGWAVSTLALFSTVNALELDARLRIAGFTTPAILIGRLVAVMLIGVALSAGYLVLVIVDQDVTRLDGVVLMMSCAIAVGAPLGMAIGLLLRRELEGALALLILLATQFMTNPDKLLAHSLPLWSVRGVADWTMELGGTSYLRDGLIHAGATLAVLLGVIALTSAFRLRLHPPHEVLQDDQHVLGPLEFDRPR
jgi:hypothetical protein